MIYFIRAGETAAVKIGFSRSPAARVKHALQNGNPEDLVIVRTIDVENGRDASTEHWLHARFDHLRIRGEWFRFDPEMLTITPPFFPEYDYGAFKLLKRAALAASRCDSRVP